MNGENWNCYEGEASLLRPPSEEFQCSETSSKIIDQIGNGPRVEEKNEESAAVAFHCTVSDDNRQPPKPKSLTFYCREPSYGVLTSEEPAVDVMDTKLSNSGTKKDAINTDGDDFDIGMMLFSEEIYPYALAGRTGFQIWPGTRILVDALTFPRGGDNMALKKWQRALVGTEGFRVLELGAGVGVVGASLAAAGAEVLLTDLSKVVEDSLIPNLDINQSPSNHSPEDQPKCPPTWLNCESRVALPIGRGWMGAAPVDWNEPLDNQLTREQRNVDLVVASDCVWLASMLNGLLNSVSAFFQESTHKGGRSPKLLLSFQRRDSDMFTTVDRVLTEIVDRQWKVECLAWYPVLYGDDASIPSDVGGKANQENTTKEVFIFEVSP